MPPRFPEFKKFELSDGDIIRPLIEKYGPETSEWTFTNLYGWAPYFDYRWTLFEDCIIVKGTEPGGEGFLLQPAGPGPLAEKTVELLERITEKDPAAAPRIDRAEKRLAVGLADRPVFTVEPLRDHYDYVYLREDLAELSGRDFHSKKNRANKFEKSYDYRFEPFTEEHTEGCMELNTRWCDWKNCRDDPGIMAECNAVTSMLEHHGKFGLRGAVLIADGTVEGFTLSERLNVDTEVIHVEKANTEFDGIYAALNKLYCERILDTKYVNREQDLGVPGIRKAKKAYNPVRMVEKFRITLVMDG